MALASAVVPGAFAQSPPTSAKVDTSPLHLTAPDRYQVAADLLPIRSVTLVAPADGIVRSQDARAGATVRANQEVAQLDKVEASARLKIAQAEVKEQQAMLAIAKGSSGSGQASSQQVAVAQARLDAAQARAELSQAELDRCTLRAPFACRILASYVSDGQYVTKGTVIAELADVLSLRALVPIARAGASVGASLKLTVEGQPATGQVQALLPLTDSLAVLRELSSPMTAAWVTIANTEGTFEPGQRVLSPDLPTTPIATVPAHALQNLDAKAGSGGPNVQVIRNEYVTNVPVRVLGRPGPDRVQVSGAFRQADALILATSVPLLHGTLVRFGGGNDRSAEVEGTTPNPSVSGESADVSPPRDAPAGKPAPIGAPGSAVPKRKTATRQSSAPAPPPGTGTKPGGTVPF
jgi:multidrug efflux pump subunit AcrA (membrane-fusion protein)